MIKKQYKGTRGKTLLFNKKYKNNVYFSDRKLVYLCKSSIQKKTTYKMNIRLTCNNIFCSLKNVKKNRNIISKSSGTLNMQISKKTLKFIHKFFLDKFLIIIKRRIKMKTLLILFNGPIKIKKLVIKQLKSFFMHLNLIILKVEETKVFNGCRVSKRKRNKNKGFRLIK